MDPDLDPEVVRLNLQYLRDHRVCETLEQITKALLQDKPQQPIETILRVLRASQSTPRGVSAALPVPSRRSSPPNALGTPGTSNNHIAITSKGLSTLQVAAPLPREESLASDASAFSIHSVDMGEFLAEFRQAYTALSHTRTLNGYITRHDLMDILDIVAIPTPDTRMLETMFADIDVGHTGKVPWDIFLARMNYKIQGKFHNDVLRMVFTTISDAEGKATWTQLLDGIVDKIGISRSEAELAEVLKQCGVCGADGDVHSCAVTFHDFVRIVHLAVSGQNADEKSFELS